MFLSLSHPLSLKLINISSAEDLKKNNKGITQKLNISLLFTLESEYTHMVTSSRSLGNVIYWVSMSPAKSAITLNSGENKYRMNRWQAAIILNR